MNEPKNYAKNRLILSKIGGMDANVLNLGSGKNYIQGAVNVDINPIYKPDILADIEQSLPFENESFDFVICSDVLEHLEMPGKTMEEIYRILDQNGKAIFSVPNSANPLYLLGLWKQETKHDTNEHRHFWRKDSFTRWLWHFGFEAKNFFPSYYSVGWQPLFDFFPALSFCMVFEAVKLSKAPVSIDWRLDVVHLRGRIGKK